MNGRTIYAAAFAVTALFPPLAAHAQGVPEGADHGARVGERAAGPEHLCAPDFSGSAPQPGLI
jgi:hypothetical protein